MHNTAPKSLTSESISAGHVYPQFVDYLDPYTLADFPSLGALTFILVSSIYKMRYLQKNG